MAALRGRTADLVKAAITPADADGVAAGGDGVSQQGAGGAAGTVGKPDGQCPVAAARGTMDFAITPLPASSAPQEFHCEPLLEYETAYMVRRGHPLAHSTSLHQLLEQDWVMSYTRKVSMRCSTRCSTATARACRASALSRRIRSACCRRWWNPPRCAPGARCRSPRCRSLPPPAAAGAAKADNRQLNIVTRRNSILSAAAHAFIDTLVRTLRQQARSSRPEDRQIYDRVRLLI